MPSPMGEDPCRDRRHNTSRPAPETPARVDIVRQGHYLLAARTIKTAETLVNHDFRGMLEKLFYGKLVLEGGYLEKSRCYADC